MKIAKHGMLGLALISMHLQVSAQKKQPAQPAVPKNALYKNASIDTEKRIQDLLQRMTVEEKVGQLSTMLGWDMYTKKGDQVGVSDAFKKAIAEQKIGNLWATLRADPWTKKTLETGTHPVQSAEATNALQRYAVENTRLGIPLLLAEECPHGHMAIGTTVFPTSIGQASTWDVRLIQEMATAIAAEARSQGAQIGYGPVLDLAREPRWSRMEETYGEDPYLIGQMGKAMVKGFQGTDLKDGKHVISTLKHFAAYGSPEGGHNGGISVVGARSLQQAYLPPFREAVKAGALSVMASYNSIDGIPCSANAYLLKDVLLQQWQFKGFTVSDLGGIQGLTSTHHVAENHVDGAAQALNAGLNVDLSGTGFADNLLKAIKQNLVSMATLDTAVGNVLRMKFNMGLFEQPYVTPATAGNVVHSNANQALAKKVAASSIVLLKNQNNVLPLSKHLQRIAVIGPNADNVYNQLGDYTAPQADGKVITVLKGIQSKLGATAKIAYVKGCAIRDTANQNIDAAVKAAQQADAVVLVLGGSSARDFETKYQSTGAAEVQKGAVSDMESGEGFDRVSLDLMGLQNKLMEKIVATGKPVVLVLIEGRPLNINYAADHVAAIVNAWYPGEAGGAAIADVLFGDYNPAGRLPVSIPKSVGQLPVYYNYLHAGRHDYVEMEAKPLYSFGFGLSYTQFRYQQLKTIVTSKQNSVAVNISFVVTNSGKVAGDEVVQLYLRDDVSSVVTPVQQLKRFERISLKPGETRELNFLLTEEDLKLLNRDMQWVVEPGNFTLMVGASSDDIRLTEKFNVPSIIKIQP
ncbi:beta-glucosidase [Chitinophaga skermanii]|uniref:Beta-glucosidase n=1 Tax=Chitinophaga skermanii TaxID=331697 RepID=A0A327Q9E0_9BACT|nr:glycoside hydrolase family 3 N-terminal domain-containing protein [Chitinophaga skermanii]RAJ00428.1 beta-glucosidase [Chitinophaga skermanii]